MKMGGMQGAREEMLVPEVVGSGCLDTLADASTLSDAETQQHCARC